MLVNTMIGGPVKMLLFLLCVKYKQICLSNKLTCRVIYILIYILKSLLTNLLFGSVFASKGNEEPRSCWSGEVYQGPTNSSEATNVAGIGEDEQGRYLMHRHPVPMLSLGPSISRVWTCHIPPYLHPRNCPLLCGYTRSGYVVAGEVWICRSSGPEWADSWPKEKMLGWVFSAFVGCFFFPFLCIYVHTLEANIYLLAGDSK